MGNRRTNFFAASAVCTFGSPVGGLFFLFVFRRRLDHVMRVPPSCIAAWEDRIGHLPSDIGQRYNNAMLTPRDWHSHFKNVMHRGLWTKGHDPIEAACRCCKLTHENLQNFAELRGPVESTIRWPALGSADFTQGPCRSPTVRRTPPPIERAHFRAPLVCAPSTTD